MNNSEREIIIATLKGIRGLCTSYDVLIPNCYTTHDNEADILAIRKSGFVDEIEVKISRSDFLADAKKTVSVRDVVQYERSSDGEIVKSLDLEWCENHPLFWKNPGNLIAPWQKLKRDALQGGLMMPNYFWYVTKAGIVELADIPKFAGWCIVFDDGEIKVIKLPDRLHKRKIDDSCKYSLAKKCCYRYLKSEFSVNF